MTLRDVFLPFLKDVVTESRYRDSMGTKWKKFMNRWSQSNAALRPSVLDSDNLDPCAILGHVILDCLSLHEQEGEYFKIA